MPKGNDAEQIRGNVRLEELLHSMYCLYEDLNLSNV